MLYRQFTAICFCFVITASAQDHPPKKNYFVLKVGSSFLSTATKKGTEQVSFPYPVKPAFGGRTSDSSFVSHLFSPLKKVQIGIYFTFELGKKDHFFEVNFGGYTSENNGSFLALGYGRNFYVGLLENIPLPRCKEILC